MDFFGNLDDWYTLYMKMAEWRFNNSKLGTQRIKSFI